MANPITRIIITAKDEASAVFGSFKTKATAVAVAVGGLFGAKLFGDAVGSARGFETAMSAVQAATGATTEELGQLRAAAEQAGATTKYTSVEAANALENLAKAGLSATDAVKTLPAVLNLAQAGGVELATAAEYVTKAVNGMGLSFGEAGRVADVLSAGANASNTSVEGLAGALSYAAPLSNSLGLSLEQTVAIIGKFADAGIDASRAGTALNSILAQFSNPASKFREELAAAGITTNDFDQALRQLAAAGPAGQKAINAVGQEAGPALRALLNQGMGALDELKLKLDQSAGSAATFAQIMGDNLDGAAKGFGSAWDSLLIKLGSPVLDTLKGQINAVAERLRGFVSDGTATAFGEALRAAFESAGKWAAEFFSNVDFTALGASMQAFAAKAGEVFTALGQQVQTASATIQTAYGVMSAGLDVVLATVYKLGQGMAWLTSAFLADLALITQGLAKVTFGDLSAGFAQAAAEMRLNAQAAGAVVQEFGKKAADAFEAASAGAALATVGFSTLTTGAQAAATAATSSLDKMAGQAGLTAAQVEALGEGAVVMGGQVVSAGAAAAAAAGNVNVLGASAASATTGVAGLGDSAEQVSAAFARLGVTSAAELNRLAANALRDFETIRASGTATPRELQQAFAAYAQKAIEANNGVASSTLRAQAGMHKVRIEVDEAGRATVSAMQSGEAATAELGAEAEATAEKVAAIGQAADGSAASLQNMGSAAGSGSAGAGVGSGGGRLSRVSIGGREAIVSRAESLGGLELRKQIEDELAKWNKRNEISLSSSGWNNYFKKLNEVDSRLDAMQIEQEKASGKYQANQPQITGSAQREQVTTYRVEIGTGAGRKTAINAADKYSADALVDLLRQLESDMSRS